MKHPVSAFALAGLALATSTYPDVSAHTPPSSQVVEILVGGQPRPLYPHGGRWYIEALRGEEYAIRLRNPYGVRVAVALSVDGLNTIDARTTDAPGARKWVLQPYQTVTIDGWQTSQTTARRFEFTTEARSYGAALGKTANLGIISAAFFRERPTLALPMTSEDSRARQAAPAAPAAPAPGANAQSASKAAERDANDQLAATGMGKETDHEVRSVWIDLEKTPVQVVSLRYEFRAQLVQLGVLPRPHDADALSRRERAKGFEPGFAPVPAQFDR
jgi:hypothetical protein